MTGLERRLHRDAKAAGARPRPRRPRPGPGRRRRRALDRVGDGVGRGRPRPRRRRRRRRPRPAADDLERARAAAAGAGRAGSRASSAPAEIARAVVESVAENTVDAVVAPAFWAAVAGAPGALGYRAVNTLDSMVGHRSPRYANYGWASARLDDAVAWVPARLTAALVALVRPAVGRERSGARCGTRRRRTPLPNAGVAEAAFAAALGVRLGGPQPLRRPRRGAARARARAGRPASATSAPRCGSRATSRRRWPPASR